MDININSTIQITGGSDFIAKNVANELTVENPKFREAINAGRSTWGLNPVIKNFNIDDSEIIHLPRGYIDRLFDILKENNIVSNVIDNRSIKHVNPLHQHIIELRDYQFKALQVLSTHTEGVLVAPAGSGKTIMGIAITIMSGQNVLWITHTKLLALQFITRAKQFITNLEEEDVGYVGAGTWTIGDKLTVGLVQTLIKSPEKLREVSGDFGMVIVDECLDYDNKVTTKEYGTKKIGVIVNNKLACHVQSFNEKTCLFEWKKVIRFFKNTQKENMLNISFGHNNSITCTKNHSIYTFNDFNIRKTISKNININDYVVIKKSFKTSSILTKSCKPLLLGMVLGDGGLSTNGRSVRLRVTNGEKQLGYLNYKKSLLKKIVKAKNGKTKSGYKPNNTVYNFDTTSFYDIDDWYGKIYENGSKTHVPEDLAKLLTIESWAIMYQDDGSISNGKYIVFSFCDFTASAITNLSGSLKHLFNIESTMSRCNRGYLYLRLNKEASKKFILTIKNFIWPGLRYKLGIYNKNIKFKTIAIPKIFENFSVLKVKNITEKKAVGGYRYNIEVQDNHNYLANNKLVGNCHHCPATTFTNVVNNLNPYYMYGLTATPNRRDGLESILFQNIGPIRHIIERDEVAKGNKIITPTIKVIKLDTPLFGIDTYHELLKALVENEKRNNTIVADVINEANQGHICIVVTDRKIHAEILLEKLQKSNIKAGIATGSYNDKFRKTTLDDLENGIINTLVCTTHLMGEGFDYAPLSRLFLGLPFRDENKCEQVVGRIQRAYQGKIDAVVYDYVDYSHGLTKHQYKNHGLKGCRYNVYRKLKCNIEE